MKRPLVNLATEPFRNRRLLWIAIVMMFLLPTIFGQQVIRQKANQEAEIQTWQTIVRELEIRLGKAASSPAVAPNQLPISSEQNREIYAASELLARKSFSWSRLLDEIERNLPAGVRVLRIGVTTVVPEEKNGAFGGSESAATLNLEVIAKSNQDVVGLINRLHESGRFKVYPISQKPVEGTPEIEFSLKTEYFP
ncbi:MAG: hypothetical protein ACK5RS_09615, partial [Acidobacteriota bacterium]